MLLNPTILGQVVVNGLALGAIYVLIALGFTLLFGVMRVVNFAHGEFAMLGGFALYYLYGTLALPWIIAVPLSAVLVAGVSLLLEALVFRWFYQKMFQSMIGLMGLSMAMTYGSVIIWDAYDRTIPSPFMSVVQFDAVVLPLDRLVVICVTAVTLVGFYLFMHRTRYGLAMRASAVDLEIASTQGIDVRLMYRMAFFIAIALAALAGGLYAQIYSLSPLMGERPLMIAFIVVVLGGMGSIPGAALGGMLLGFSESFLGTFYGAAMSSFVSFGAVMLLLIFRPWGLLGTPE
jgi:branched-chain amino acid transport system permease protein